MTRRSSAALWDASFNPATGGDPFTDSELASGETPLRMVERAGRIHYHWPDAERR